MIFHCSEFQSPGTGFNVTKAGGTENTRTKFESIKLPGEQNVAQDQGQNDSAFLELTKILIGRTRVS